MSKAGIAKHQRPKLLSDNGSCYIASELKEHLKQRGIQQVHGRQNHPQTQGKIERYHRSMKNVVKLDHYYCPEELNAAMQQFVHYYNHQRYHESLDNVKPADVYWCRKEQILKKREQAKKQSLAKRRELYQMEKLKLNPNPFEYSAGGIIPSNTQKKSNKKHELNPTKPSLRTSPLSFDDIQS